MCGGLALQTVGFRFALLALKNKVRISGWVPGKQNLLLNERKILIIVLFLKRHYKHMVQNAECIKSKRRSLETLHSAGGITIWKK